MKTFTVRDFHHYSQLDGGKTYQDLPVVFEGTLKECHEYCQKQKWMKWRADESLFGGYYVDNEGKCLMIV